MNTTNAQTFINSELSAVSAIAGTAAFATTVAIAVAVTTATVATLTAATFAARTAGGLLFLIAFGLGEEGLAAELDLAVLLIKGDDLHLELIAHLDETFERLGVTPLVLADMHQAFLAGQELHKGAELDDADDLGVEDIAHLGNGADVLNPFEGGSDVFFVLRGDVDNAKLALFFDIDDGVGLGLNLLDDLATLADDGTDEVFRNLDLLDAGHEVLVVLTGLGDGLENLVEDVETTLTGLLKGLGEDVVAEAVDLDIHLAGGDTVAGAADFDNFLSSILLRGFFVLSL